MPDLTSLLERVRAASGPDRELDRDIVLALFPDIGPYNPPCIGDEPIFWHEPYRKQPAPELTGSIDAAVALVGMALPGWWWSCGTCELTHDGFVKPGTRGAIGPDFRSPAVNPAHVSQFDGGFDVARENGNAALALIEATLLALTAMQKD